MWLFPVQSDFILSSEVRIDLFIKHSCIMSPLGELLYGDTVLSLYSHRNKIPRKACRQCVFVSSNWPSWWQESRSKDDPNPTDLNRTRMWTNMPVHYKNTNFLPSQNIEYPPSECDPMCMYIMYVALQVATGEKVCAESHQQHLHTPTKVHKESSEVHV